MPFSSVIRDLSLILGDTKYFSFFSYVVNKLIIYMNIFEIFINSIQLIITFDQELWDIIFLSLFVSFTALIIASILGFLIGYFLALYNFF